MSQRALIKKYNNLINMLSLTCLIMGDDLF